MKINFQIIIIFIIITFSYACSSTKKEKPVETEIAEIEQLINNNFYNLARIKIDSFHVKYRNLVDKRRLVTALQDTITLRESYRTIQYCDTVLPKLIFQRDSMMKNFRLEKDTLFQETGDYVHKLLKTEQNLNRNFLKVKIDEKGELKLFSFVTGVKIAHKHLLLSSGDMFAETDTLVRESISEHEYNDGENHIESVIFWGESVENIVKFIYDNQTSKVKVTIRGNRTYSYFLPPQDIKAIAESYHFWIVTRDIVKLDKQLKISIKKINKIKSYYNYQKQKIASKT